MSQRMLRWHYRSRHHSLIAVSNREFYDSRLFVVPSPTTITAMHGLHFRPVKDGVFDRGNSATNRVEAQGDRRGGDRPRAAISQAIPGSRCLFGLPARRHPRRARGLAARTAELAPFFSSGRPEPFFVKNLENIQGDERDVIFISVGYARDASGYLAMNFGPLSSAGRRAAAERPDLAGSRALRGLQLDHRRRHRPRSGRGREARRHSRRSCATPRRASSSSQPPTDGDYDSDFERQVAMALEGLGHEVHRQVGTAGFIIDLAIVDPVTARALPAGDRVRRGDLSFLAVGPRSRPAAGDRPQGPGMEDPSGLEHRLVPPPGRAVAEDRRRDREGPERLEFRRGSPSRPGRSSRGHGSHGRGARTWHGVGGDEWRNQLSLGDPL